MFGQNWRRVKRITIEIFQTSSTLTFFEGLSISLLIWYSGNVFNCLSWIILIVLSTSTENKSKLTRLSWQSPFRPLTSLLTSHRILYTWWVYFLIKGKVVWSLLDFYFEFTFFTAVSMEWKTFAYQAPVLN